MILVADCSALVALLVCGSLNLLEQLFASVVVCWLTTISI